MKHFIIVFTALFLFSCGSKKIVEATEEKSTENYSAERALASYNESTIDYNTLSTKMKCRFEDKDRSLSFKTSVQIQKNEKIWVSATMFGFEGARALITPDSVKVINRIEREYYEESIDQLQTISGLPVDFYMLQQLATGQILTADAENMSITQKDGVYELISELGNISTLAWLDDANFKLKQQNMIEHSENSQMEITYHNYQPINNAHFPYENSVYVSGKREIWLNLEYTDIQINGDVSFSFSIPRGYKKVIL